MAELDLVYLGLVALIGLYLRTLLPNLGGLKLESVNWIKDLLRLVEVDDAPLIAAGQNLVVAVQRDGRQWRHLGILPPS